MLHLMLLENQIKERYADLAREAATERLLQPVHQAPVTRLPVANAMAEVPASDDSSKIPA